MHVWQVREDQLQVEPVVLTKKQKKLVAAAALAAEPSDDSPFADEDLSVFQEQVEEQSAVDGAVDELVGKVVQETKMMKEDLPVSLEAKQEAAKKEVAKKEAAKKAKGKKRKAEETEEMVDETAVPATPAPTTETIFDRASSFALFFRALLTYTSTVEKDLPAWAHLPLPLPLYRALSELNFSQPTAIQERALSVEIGAKPYVAPILPQVEEEEEEEEWGGIIDPSAPVVPAPAPIPYVSPFIVEPPTERELHPNTTDRDLVGVAQTGSGKTLAYGLPILAHILSSPPPAARTSDDEEPVTRLAALILAPTRELALQVRAAISEVAIRTNRLLPEELQDPNVNAPRKRERGRHVSVVALTGGMSVEKQKRQLSRGADILVATPGRLWDLIGEVNQITSGAGGGC